MPAAISETAEGDSAVSKAQSDAIRGFVCYGISATVDGRTDLEFDDLIDVENWSGAEPLEYESDPESGVDAKLFVVQSRRREPDWAGFMRSGFGPDIAVQASAPTGALLLVRVPWKNSKRYFAFTFGTGRFLLRDDCYTRRFGLRVALNALFEGDTNTNRVDSTRIRSVSAKRVSGNTVRSQHQSTRAADLEAFDVDRDRDFLRGVTGLPVHTERWGTNLTGADSLTSGRTLRFRDLPKLCLDLLNAERSRTYRHRFGWIDDVAPVEDKSLKRRLEQAVIERLQAEELDDLDLAVPELVDWNQVKNFVLPYQRRGRQRLSHPELRLEDYVRAARLHGGLDELDGRRLRQQRIEVKDDAGGLIHRWAAWRCLTAEIALDGQHYVLDEGEFYEVGTDYIETLNRAIARHVPETTLQLPSTDVRTIEETYNKAAAEGALLLLDRCPVQIASSTSPVEICDLLSASRQFIHVKRKLGSSVLSHLFAQGFVSADLLQSSPEYRTEVDIAIREAFATRETRCATLRLQDFDYVSDVVRPDQVEVVYAVIADWGSTSLVERLPFFSKITLRRHAVDLRNRGFNVTHCRIQATRGTA